MPNLAQEARMMGQVEAEESEAEEVNYKTPNQRMPPILRGAAAYPQAIIR